MGFGGVRDLAHTLPGYGDAVEVVWATSWYDTALRTGGSLSVFPLAFFPQGWRMATFGEGWVMLLSFLPLDWLAGPAFAYNAFVILNFVLAFGGALLLGRRFFGRLGTTVFALTFTFWGFRWFQNIGHPNVLLGSALIPWLLWGLERAYHARRHRWPWLIMTGVIFAGMVSGSMYFVWLGGLLVAGWNLGRRWGRQIGWPLAVQATILPIVVGMALSAPTIIASWQASSAVGAHFDDIWGVNYWGASLNSLLAPYVYHPWLGSLARTIYNGPAYEQGVANLGPLALIVALLALPAAWRDRTWRPALILIPLGILLSLGLTLKWNNVAVQWPVLRPLDEAIWALGHALKPGFFPASGGATASGAVPEPFATAIPLPGMLLAICVPFIERARVFARYAMIANAGIALLAAFAVHRLRLPWARWLLALLLVVEVIPAPLNSVPYPPQTHPAFEWLKQQEMPGESIADVMAAYAGTLVLANRGETVFATGYHGKPTVAGASSVWPAHTVYLNQWLGSHPHAFARSDFIPLLRFYRVRYVVLHMQGPDEAGILEEARGNAAVRDAGCFQPPSGPGPWPYPICILEVLPPETPEVNLMFQEGWSGQESWGIWLAGTSARAEWVATTRGPQRLSIAGFPLCVPGKEQELQITVNGQDLGGHRWGNCEPWSAEITIPASLVRLGGNELVVRSAYAARPADLPGDTTGDGRTLSIGLTTLKVEGMGEQ